MKSINTIYNGNYFRSRLEARWALFFDKAGITYEYEPEGFTNGVESYLPDFYLPEAWMRNHTQGIYIEIKPTSYKDDSVPASKWFDRPLVLFKGLPIGYDNDNGYELEGGFECWGNMWDNYMRFFLGNRVIIDYVNRSYNHNPQLFYDASTAALLKRFEHNAP
jgi:hypothetical protein